MEKINPSYLIYEAWKKSKKPITYEVKNAKPSIEIKTIDFVNPEENPNYNESYTGLCNLCGKETHGGIPINKIFSAKYMDWSIHKEPEATHICKSCAFCIGMNPIGRITLFRYPVVADRELHLCNRNQFREYLLNPPEPPFIMIFPTSQKKHLFAKSKVSYSQDNYFCNLEEITVPVNKKIKQIMSDIEALRGIGFTKDNITMARIPGNIIKKYSLDTYDYERLITKMEKLAESEMFSLSLEVSQKMEEEKSACYLGLTLKTK